VILTIGLGCLTTVLILLGHIVGSWVGGWIGELGAALGMLVGAWCGLVAGTLIAEAVGVSFRHRCSL
jgi:putative Mn2+ efflux pump MntP